MLFLDLHQVITTHLIHENQLLLGINLSGKKYSKEGSHHLPLFNIQTNNNIQVFSLSFLFSFLAFVVKDNLHILCDVKFWTFSSFCQNYRGSLISLSLKHIRTCMLVGMSSVSYMHHIGVALGEVFFYWNNLFNHEQIKPLLIVKA